MSMINRQNRLQGTFERNLSCPASMISDRKTSDDFPSKRSTSISIGYNFTSSHIQIENILDNQHSINKSWIDRCKQSLKSLFKQISRSVTKQGK